MSIFTLLRIYCHSIILKFIVKYFSLILFSVFCIQTNAQHFDFNERCRSAYTEILKLQRVSAEVLIAEERAENPENLIPLLLEDYIDILTIYLTEDEALLNELERNKGIRLDAFEKAPDSDPYKNYAMSSVHLHWAIARIKFEEYLTTATEIYKSYNLVNANKKAFPDFKPNNLALGLYETLFGTIPSSYSWLTNFLGFRGDINEGMAKVEAYKLWSENEGEGLLYDEANIFYIYLLMFLADGTTEAWNLCLDEMDDPNHLMNVFLVSDIAYKSGNSSKALNFLSQAVRNNSKTIPFPFLDFMEGQMRLAGLETDAGKYFKQYLASETNVHYIKDALQRLSFSYLINGDTLAYKNTLARIPNEGATFFDCDKQALFFSENKEIPHVELLKSRLLFDGGYYSEAKKILSTVDKESLNSADMMEYTYRYARIYEMIGEKPMAFSYYKDVIDLGSINSKVYFPARSSLAMARMYEADMNYPKAKKCFEDTMMYKAHAFSDSFEQQAKAGLNRIKNKL